MHRDPWSNEQLRFDRQMKEPYDFERKRVMQLPEKILWACAFIGLIVLLISD